MTSQYVPNRQPSPRPGFGPHWTPLDDDLGLCRPFYLYDDVGRTAGHGFESGH